MNKNPESSSLESTSRLILLRSTLRIPFSSLENMPIPESLSTKTTSSLDNIASSSLLIKIFVTN